MVGGTVSPKLGRAGSPSLGRAGSLLVVLIMLLSLTAALEIGHSAGGEGVAKVSSPVPPVASNKWMTMCVTRT